MQLTVGKAFGSLVALGYAVSMVIRSGGVTGHVVMGCGALLLPLAFIWFPKEIGGITASFGIGQRVDTQTPPVVVSCVGWFFLVGFPLAFFFLS
jgi:hypothetical protein